jgi:acetyl esterase/lipase
MQGSLPMRVSRWVLVAGSILASGFGVLSACSTVAIFDAVVPKDAGASLAKADIAYGKDVLNRLDVYVPDPAASGAPVVVFMYGGSWNSGSKNDYSFAGRAFAARGFVTVIPDTRLVPQVRFPAFVEDEALALRWVHDHIAEFGGDRERIYVAGHSSGAYSAVMLALDAQYLKAVGLGPHVIKRVAGLSGPYDFLPLDVEATKEAFGQVTNLAATQPVNLASRAAPPMFLATGSADTLVQPRNSAALARKLRRAGASVIEKIYPGVSHSGTVAALSRPFRGEAPVLDDIVAFFSR